MKTKITLPNLLNKASGFFLMLMLLVFSARAQNTTGILLTNCSSTSNTLEFDLFISNTGTNSTMILQSGAYGIDWNAAGCLNGGTASLSYIAGSSQLSASMSNFTTTNSFIENNLPSAATATRTIRINAQIATPAANGTPLAPGAPVKVGRFRITNTANWTANSSPNFVFNTVNAVGKTRTAVTTYLNGASTGTPATFAITIDPSCVLNLNAPTCVAPTLSASTVAATCAGGNDGSIDLTITGGNPSPFSIIWSNGAVSEDISGLTAGTYTVTVTTDGGQCTATQAFTVNDGAANVTYFADGDGDGFGDNGNTQVSCTGAPVGYVAVGGDCNDGDNTVNPGVSVDGCNGIDNDCDGLTDEDATFLTYYVDGDNDGFGAGAGTSSCSPIAGSVTVAGDCNDGDNTVNPGVLVDGCNGVDNDCDGSTDEDATFLTYYVDGDNDGFGAGAGTSSCSPIAGSVTVAGDCNDGDNTVNPGVLVDGCNGVDNDCDGSTDEDATFLTYYVDGDVDGFGAGAGTLSCSPIAGSVTVAGDCNDGNNAIFPGATEVCNNIDDNCDGNADEGLTFVTYYADADLDTYGDPFTSLATCSGAPAGYVTDNTDCNDNNPAINPAGTEICNNIDDDCDGTADDGLTFLTYYVDGDGDGFGAGLGTSSCVAISGSVTVAGDCNDADNTVNPGVAVDGCNGVDNDCDGSTDEDATFLTYYVDGDGDGFGAGLGTSSCSPIAGSVTVAGDCNDGDNTVNPGVLVDGCNGVDNDCDGSTDEDATFLTYYVDGDGDGFGAGLGTSSCSPIAGSVTVAGDCNDGDNTVNPGVLVDGCNGVDNDCDGSTDEDAIFLTYYVDGDGDGFGAGLGTSSCSPIAGSVTVDGDCNDANGAVNPGATEVCNNVDDDCDGSTDEGLTFLTYYVDGDGDGFGAGAGTSSCVAIPGSVTVDGDCNDASNTVFPGAPEQCNNIDDDCDGSTDEGVVVSTWYQDLDGDTYGNPAVTLSNCAQPVGYVLDNTDCNDGSAAVNPGATEVCNNIDDDCDGSTDEGVQNTYYADTDGDSFGNPAVTTLACTAPVGFVADNTDCDDTNGAVNPGATEVCNSIDDDCDGSTDEGVQNTYYADNDGDSYGNAAVTATGCTAPVGFVAVSGDCDDTNGAVNPGATEVCNNVDDDCDGLTDEGVLNTYYADGDGDNFGNSAVTATGCTAPVGFVAVGGDCDDSNAAINPGAAEVCNNIDDDCDGSTDEGLPTFTYYADADADTYGNAGNSITTCAVSAPSGYVTNSTDCDDNNAAVNPAASEVCGNNIDDNCDGSTDEGCGCANPPTANAGGDQTVCAGQNATLNGAIGGGATNGTWSTAGDGSFSPSASVLNATYIPGPNDIANGSVLLTLTTDAGPFCTPATSSLTLTIQALPASPGAIAGPPALCNPNNIAVTYSIAPVAGATSYTWTVPAGTVLITGQGTTSITVSWPFTNIHNSVVGNICVTANNSNSCGSGTPSCLAISVRLTAPVTPNSISGPSKACPGETATYSVALVNRADLYTWSVPAGASIISGQGSNIIQVQYSAGFTGGPITVSASNICGASPVRTRNVGLNILPASAAISGQTSGVCGASGVAYTATAVVGASSYFWTVPAGATIVSGQGSASISVDFSGAFSGGPITVLAQNGCGNGAVRSVTVSGAPGIAAPISGSVALCANQNYLYSVPTLAGAATYTWTVPAGFVIQSGQGTKDLTVKAAANPNTGLTISVRGSNACGTGPIRSLNGISITLCPRIGEAGAMNIVAYPNPVSDLLNIGFDSDKNQDVLVTMSDAAGRVVLSENRNADEGANKFEVSVKGMASGIYTLNLRTADAVQQVRVVVE